MLTTIATVPQVKSICLAFVEWLPHQNDNAPTRADTMPQLSAPSRVQQNANEAGYSDHRQCRHGEQYFYAVIVGGEEWLHGLSQSPMPYSLTI